MSEVLRLDAITRRYGELTIFEDLDLALGRGEAAALLGPSGSGKSSLLHIAGLLEKPSAGEVYLHGKATSSMKDRQRTALRRQAIGFVYQFHHLLPEFSALTNVMMPLLISGEGKGAARDRGEELLTRLGLAERLTHQPAQLSGGEKQRVAIARALAQRPQLVLADEPTGNLDQETSSRVFDLLLELVDQEGVAMVVATHDQTLARRLPRILTIEDKRLLS
jgi:lipoprotein-releasing system ATP-binding protein